MPDEIQPALTPEEWNNRELADGTLEIKARAADGALMLLDADSRILSPAPAMALANAALSDDDPRKITPHSVWIIRKLIDDAYIDMQHPGAIRFRRDAEQLAAKLSALLPPGAT